MQETSPQKIRFLSREDVQECLSMSDAIGLMKETFVKIHRKEMATPRRMHLDIPEHNGVGLIKPAYDPVSQRIGLKIISLFKDNPTKGLPFSHALMLLFDGETGIPLAIMDGDSLTAIRTGAASGLATDYLARRDANTIAIFGAGKQGWYQIEAVRHVRNISHCIVFDLDKENAQSFRKIVEGKLALKVEIAETAEKLLEADIICTATTSSIPVFSDMNLKKGAHINAIGSFKPNEREIPSATVRRSKIVVDEKMACLLEAGDIIIPINESVIDANHIYGELGEIVLGEKAGRTSPHEITLFKSVGNAAQDLAAASKVFNSAVEKELGIQIEH
jgi:ornithine cyclodeaminase/alanine dehydrogenase-like protein (mu-crystallin family)